MTNTLDWFYTQEYEVAEAKAAAEGVSTTDNTTTHQQSVQSILKTRVTNNSQG